MEQLLVRLGASEAEPVSWLVWSSTQNEIIASGQLEDASQLITLQERASKRPVIALVPTSDVVLKWVTLPAKANRKVMAAIPFMLEDEISDDISQCFFAMGPKQGKQQAVAVVQKQKMQMWKDQLLNAGLSCEKVIPDTLAVPINPEGLSVLQLNEQMLVRQDEWCGIQGEDSWIVPVISHLTKTHEQPVSIHNYSDMSLHAVPNASVEAKTLELPMEVLVKGAMSQHFNLFQGEFKQRKTANKGWQKWRLAAALAILSLVTTLIDKAVTIQSLSAQNDRLATQIQEQVKAGFPNMGTYRDLRRKVNSEMAKLESGGGGVSVLVMLTQLQPAFAQSQIKPQSVRFDGSRKELRLQAVASSFESLEQFTRQAEQLGFTVEQGAINNRENGLVGAISIRSEV